MNHNTSNVGASKPGLAIGLAVVLLFSVGPAVQAQVVYGDPARVSQSFTYLHWNLKSDSTDASISEWVVPVSGMVPMSDNTELRYYTSLAGAGTSDNGFDHDLSGMTDSRIQLARSLAGDQFLLSVGLNIPTGKKELDSAQFDVIRAVSAEYFNFPVKTFGEGLGYYAELLGAAQTGEWIVGGGFGALYSEAYEPADDAVSYHPGLRLYLTGSAEIKTGENANNRVNIDGVLMVSAADKADDKEVFKDGIQLDFSASGIRRFNDWSGGAALRVILRAKDQRLTQERILATESYATNGSEVRFTLHWAREFSNTISGLADFTGKFVGANGYPKDDPQYEGGASLYGIGGQINGRFSNHAYAGFGVRKWFGNTKETGKVEALDLSGWEIAQSFTVTF